MDSRIISMSEFAGLGFSWFQAVSPDWATFAKSWQQIFSQKQFENLPTVWATTKKWHFLKGKLLKPLFGQLLGTIGPRSIPAYGHTGPKEHQIFASICRGIWQSKKVLHHWFQAVPLIGESSYRVLIHRPDVKLQFWIGKCTMVGHRWTKAI